MKINNKKIFLLTLALFIALAALFTGCNWFNASAKVEKQLDLAVKYLSESKYEEAVLAYQEVIKIDKKNVPAYKGLSVVYTLQENPEQAEQALRDGLEQVAGSAALKLALAGLMADQSRVDQAEAIYKEVIARDGSCLSAYQAYARLLAGLNRKNDAVALLEKAASGNAGQYRISSLLAEQYVKTGSRDKALSAVSRSLTAEPNQAAAYKMLEDLYNGRWAELVSLGEQYILQGKPVPGTVIKLTGLYRLGKYGDMIKLYDQLAGDIKFSPKVRLLAAQAYLKLGQKDQGLGLGSDLKPADIKDPALLAEIAGFYLETGDKDAARGLALRGIGLDDTVLDNYVVLSKSYQEEDKSQSDIWLAKYLLGSAYSVKEAKKEQESYRKDNNAVIPPAENKTETKGQAVNYKTFVNQSDGGIGLIYSFEYPDNFLQMPEPAHGVGRDFVSPDRRTRLYTGAYLNPSGVKVAADMQDRLAQINKAGGRVITKDSSGEWYQIKYSHVENNTLFQGNYITYERKYITPGKQGYIYLKYPEEESSKYDTIAERLIASFKFI